MGKFDELPRKMEAQEEHAQFSTSFFIPSCSNPHCIQLPENSISTQQTFPSLGETFTLYIFFYLFCNNNLFCNLSYWNKFVKHFKQCKNFLILLKTLSFSLNEITFL
jgi:hypothetical protein